MGEHVKIARSRVPAVSLDPPSSVPSPFVEVPATGGMDGRARVERADRFGHHLENLGSRIAADCPAACGRGWSGFRASI
jgi:hypothetical protein